MAGLRASRGWCGTAADGRLVLIDPQRATARNRHTARMKRRCSRVWQAKYLARSLVVQSARVRIHAARRNLLRIAYDRATRSLMPTQASGRNYLSRAKNTLTRPTTTHRRRAHASRTSVPRGKIRALDTSLHAVASAAPPAPIALVEFSRSAGIVRVARRIHRARSISSRPTTHTRPRATRSQEHKIAQDHKNTQDQPSTYEVSERDIAYMRSDSFMLVVLLGLW